MACYLSILDEWKLEMYSIMSSLITIYHNITRKYKQTYNTRSCPDYNVSWVMMKGWGEKVKEEGSPESMHSPMAPRQESFPHIKSSVYSIVCCATTAEAVTQVKRDPANWIWYSLELLFLWALFSRVSFCIEA